MTDSGDGRMTAPWTARDLLPAGVLVLACLASMLLVARAATALDLAAPSTLRSAWFASSLHGALVLSAWLFAVRRYRQRWSALGLRPTPAFAASTLPFLALMLSLAFIAAYTVAVDRLGFDLLIPSPMDEELLGRGPLLWLNALCLVAWVPFAEEVFFRGFLMAALVEPLGTVRAALLSSLVFAAGHLTLSSLVPLFVTGLLLSWLYVKTRSVWPPMAAHAAQNLLAVLATA